MSMKIRWVIYRVLPLTEDQYREFDLENSTCIGCILSLLSDQLCDIYMKYTSAHELWDALDRKYAESDAGRELYVNDQYHGYKMVDDRAVMEQAHEIQLLVGELAHFDCVLLDKFVVGGIISKLPPSWRSFSKSLKHKKEIMTVESLISPLDVEEKARSKDVPRLVLQEGGPSNANVVEGKSGGSNKNNKNWKGKAKQSTNFKKKKNKEYLTCFVCGEPNHIARKCRQRKGKKGGQKTANVTIGEAGGSGLPTVPPS